MRQAKTPAPFARSQQLLGVPEHPLETTFRNGCLICPYEEMEVQVYPEHSGLYLIPLLGEPFELFGRDGFRAAQSWEPELPVAVHKTVQQGIEWEEHAFCLMPETDKVVALADLFGVTTDYLLRQQSEPAAKQEPPRQEKRSGRDFIERAAYLAKTKGYLLGWVLVAWGVLDLVILLLMSLGGFGFLSIL